VEKKKHVDRCFDEDGCGLVSMLGNLQGPDGSTSEGACLEHEKEEAVDAEAIAVQTPEQDPDVDNQWSVEPTAQTAGIELEVAAAGGEVIDACAGKQPATKPKEGGPSIVHLQAPKNLDEAGYNNYRPRPKCSGSLWTTILLWMSGSCGLYLYIVLCILAKSSSLWFHAHNWAVGADPKPRLLQSDGSFLTLPAGMQACTLPDTSLSFLREINIKLAEWEETFASQLQLAEQHLSSRLQEDVRQRIPDAYSRAGKQYVKHVVS
jgi:hypothetical protein